MAYPWTSTLHQLRRRALFSGAVAGVGQVVPWITPLAIAYVGVSFFSPWTRYLAPIGGGLVLALVIAAAIFGLLRASHSEIYFAKWIDLKSGLDDRLTSAVEWCTLAELSDFQRHCIDELSLQLGARYWTLVLPPTAPRRWPLTLALVVVLACLPLSYLRRTHLPAEKDARSKVVVATNVSQAAARSLADLQKQSQLLKDPQLEQLSTELSSALREIDQGSSTREGALERLERLREQLQRAGGSPSTSHIRSQGDTGATGALSRAVAQGSASGTAEAMAKLDGALRAGDLSEEDVGELVAILEHLQAIARPVDSAISARLGDTVRRLGTGDQRGAAEQLAAVAATKLAPLDRALATAAAIDRASDAVESVSRAIGRNADGAGGDSGVAGTEGATVAGGGTPSQHIENPANPGRSTNEVAVHGTWNGKVMRQLFDSAGTDAASDEAKQMLVEHDRVVEERFRRDEVPQEYEAAVRAYFAALHRKGK